MLSTFCSGRLRVHGIFFVPGRHVGASCISLAPTFFKSQSVLIPLLLLFRKRSRSRRLFACKRAHDGFGSLPTFCGDAGQCIFFVVPFQSECLYGHSDFYFSNFVMNIGTTSRRILMIRYGILMGAPSFRVGICMEHIFVC